ncbi:ABC transporter substrate-binding protein [Pseudomonas sp. ML96]|uniref:substrate-binding periplasmic protein n=1 Tax=Pseudomonas sp. ML96 TaxID=1523503 RepID=UPI0005BA441B|nr:transporter substrate-binding domain-containing protein [Pseudomonas sp. ML96]
MRLFLSLLLLCPALLLAEPKDIDLYMPDAPPLAALGNGQHGITGDIAIMALERAGYRASLRSEPWLRAQKRAQESQLALLVPLSRTPEREARFTWVANILPMPRAFFSLQPPVNSLEEARQRYRLVAVGLGTAQEEILRGAGFSDAQLYPLRLGERPVRMVRMGRVDAWFTTEAEGRFQWDSGPALHMSPPMANTDMYIACSLQCDPVLARAVHLAVEQMRQDGTLQRVIDHYLPPATNR